MSGWRSEHTAIAGAQSSGALPRGPPNICFMTRSLSQSLKADQPQHTASHASQRVFTGNANVRSQAYMDATPADTGCTMSGVAPAEQPPSGQPVFEFTGGTASVSPSKKRVHDELKKKKNAALASAQPRSNPFAQYGVSNNAGSAQSSNATCRGSPNATRSGHGPSQQSPRRIGKVVRPSDMHVDSGSVPQDTAPPTNSASTSQPAAASVFRANSSGQPPSTAQPRTAPLHNAAAKMFNAQPSSNPSFSQSLQPQSASIFGIPASQTAASKPAATAAATSFSSLDVQPDQPSTTASQAEDASASTPERFRFGSAGQRGSAGKGRAAGSSPFKGFGLHADDDVDTAPATPSAGFAGFQPGVQSEPSFHLAIVLIPYSCLLSTFLANMGK